MSQYKVIIERGFNTFDAYTDCLVYLFCDDKKMQLYNYDVIFSRSLGEWKARITARHLAKAFDATIEDNL